MINLLPVRLIAVRIPVSIYRANTAVWSHSSIDEQCRIYLEDCFHTKTYNDIFIREKSQKHITRENHIIIPK